MHDCQAATIIDVRLATFDISARELGKMLYMYQRQSPENMKFIVVLLPILHVLLIFSPAL